VNIKELFGKAENGTLTWEQFEALAKADNAKFTDLSEGKYVSKSKYDDDLGARDNSISQLNDTIAQRDTDLESLKTQLASAGTDADKLSKLQADFDTLQGKYTSDMQAYQQQLASQRYEFAVKEFANSKKFTSNAAKRDFTSAMISANLKFDADKGKILGAEDFVTSYSEDNADAFVTEQPQVQQPQQEQPKPQFAQPTNPGGTQDKLPTLTELMMQANANSK
jgi:hypothetical protein